MKWTWDKFGVHVIRWSDDPETLIRNAMHAAKVNTVLFHDTLGRAVVLVEDDQLSQAIGPRGQIVRLAQKLCGWDIEITTASKLEQQIRRAKLGFRQLEGVTDELADSLVEHGYLSHGDLAIIEPENLLIFAY